MKDEHKQKYSERVQRFAGFLKKHIKKRSWFSDLSKFEPGEYFFDKALKADENSAKDKQNFYRDLLATAHERFGDDAEVKSGFAIEPDITDAHEKEQHELFLSYEWWIRIYNLARREHQFNDDEEFTLEYKRKQLFNQVKNST